MSEGWIGVDLDGTLAHYDGWRGIDHIGDPILPMLDRVKAWLAEGKRVKIFTARVCRTGEEGEQQVRAIEGWLEDVGLPKLEITNQKDFNMIELWDDRSVQVKPNTGRPVSERYSKCIIQGLRDPLYEDTFLTLMSGSFVKMLEQETEVVFENDERVLEVAERIKKFRDLSEEGEEWLGRRVSGA